jgi:hypothetical protein
VIVHRLQQVQLVRVVTNELTYRIQSGALVFEFPRWPGCANVSGREPESISNIENILFLACLLHLSPLGSEQVLLNCLVSFLQHFEQGICLDLGLEDSFFRYFTLYLAMLMIHCSECVHPCGSLYGVGVFEFRQTYECNAGMVQVVAEGL